MYRLFVTSDEPSLWARVASRIPAITIKCGTDPTPCADAEDPHQAVVLTGSSQMDSPLIVRLLRNGKHVLYSGAPTFTQSEIANLREVAQQSHVRFALVNPDRCLPSRQIIRSHVPDKMGRVGLLRTHRWVAAMAMVADPTTMPGPVLRDLDLAVWFFGSGPTNVYVVENRDDACRSLLVHLGFAHGGMALIGYDSRLPHGDGYQSLSVIGASGAAYADDHQNMQLLFRGGLPSAIRTDEGIKASAEMIQSFVAAVQGDRDLTDIAFDWRRVIPVADAISESLRTHQAVHLEDR